MNIEVIIILSVIYVLICITVWFTEGFLEAIFLPLIVFLWILENVVWRLLTLSSNIKISEQMQLEDLRKKAEESAMWVSVAYRVIYVLVAVGLFRSRSFWPLTIGFLLAAVGFEVIEYVGSIISWYLCYLNLRRKGIKDSDTIEKPSFANTIYWVCWTMKVLMTVGIIVSIGHELFKFIQ